MIRKTPLLCAAALVALAACNTPPPRPWLRYELDGVTEWVEQGPGRYGGQVLGADVTIDLFHGDTTILVVVENRGSDQLTVKVGPDAGAPDAAIGEVLMRKLDGAPAGGPDMQAYVAMAPRTVEAGWRATFYLDQPIGQEPKLGQYFVFATEIEHPSGERVRRRLPVVGKMGGTPRTRAR